MLDRSLISPERTEWTPRDAFDWCLALARRHYENFPVASLLIPRHLRNHVAAVYAFARIADDLADEPGLERQERLGHLDAWKDQFETASHDERSSHPVFVALSITRSAFDVPPNLFTDLLSAFRQDVITNRYRTFSEILDYCSRSANPVGRIMLRLFGHDDEQLDRQSDAICTALQLTNFWQDLSQDLRRDRSYLPYEDLDRFGIPHDLPRIGADEQKFRDLIAFQVSRTREFFLAGKPLLDSVESAFSRQLRLTWHGGMRILEKIERTGYNVLYNRPRLMGIDAAVVGYRAFTRT